MNVLNFYIGVNQIVSIQQCPYGVVSTNHAGANGNANWVITPEPSSIIQVVNTTYIVKGLITPPTDNLTKFITLPMADLISENACGVKARAEASSQFV